jgi:glycosyltransferase involved in cell wall biosynthesis
MIAKRQKYNPVKKRAWAARQADDALRVGFISAAYMASGGTETFHRSLLPRLRSTVDVAGFVATAFHGGDGSKLEVQYETGTEAAKQLASHCSVIVAWGIQDLAKILPADRPRVIAVHHSDWSSDWSNRLILNQLDLIDEVICVNADTAAQLSACGKPTHWIPNAIDPTRIIPSGQQTQLRAQYDIPAGSKIVLFGHRMSVEKRPQLAVEVARQLPSDWVMVIAGDGPERAAIESAECDRVRIVGAVESLADWLSISACFLSLSTFEGFGLSIGEAMAAGVPTVSTPAGIAPELATTLPTDSTAAEWATAIVNAKAEVQPADILERFSVDRMVDAWAGILKANTRAKG